jgi:hypothetical protein
MVCILLYTVVHTVQLINDRVTCQSVPLDTPSNLALNLHRSVARSGHQNPCGLRLWSYLTYLYDVVAAMWLIITNVNHNCNAGSTVAAVLHQNGHMFITYM